MEPVIDLLVDLPAVGTRLDVFLRQQNPEQSRAFLQKLIENQAVLVNGQSTKAGYRLRLGDRICLRIPPPRPLENLPQAIDLDVLFEDDDLIVVNKAAGMVVHPAAGNLDGTLVNALLHHCRGRLAGIGGVQRPGIVHRLDKGTSGCIVVAKTDSAHQALVRQFKARTVRKVYRAVCRPGFRQSHGRIETLIGRSEHDRKKMSARAKHGRPAVTEYRVLRDTSEAALVEVVILTGRTHQVRLHLAHIGHPILGDSVYGKGAGQMEIARPLLHAYKLTFDHPRSGESMTCSAPIPADMRDYGWPD